MNEASVGHLNTCAHPGCLCLVKAGEQYCGDYCRGLSQDSDKVHDNTVPRGPTDRCGCNHSACEEPRV